MIPPQVAKAAPVKEFDMAPIAAAVAPMALALPANAFSVGGADSFLGLPMGLLVTFAAPAFALLVVITVIGPGTRRRPPTMLPDLWGEGTLHSARVRCAARPSPRRLAPLTAHPLAGALQQVGRILKGDSRKYFGEN